jgi:hypothetical protein
MLDLVQAQKDLTHALLSAENLRSVAVLSYRAKRIANELDYRTFLTTGRNGRTGAFVMVMMPEALSGHRNVTGPILDWDFPVICIEQPDLNLDSQNGTLLSAEEIGQRVMDALHLHADEYYGTFAITGKAMKAEGDFVFPGCIGYRVTLSLSVGRNTQTARCAGVAVAIGTGTCTLTCATVGAEIYYTTDGTFPSWSNTVNPSAILYETPFAVVSGDIIRACAYAMGYNASPVRRVVAT